MRQFFKFFSASCLGTVVGLGLLFLILLLVGSSLVSSMDQKVSVGPNSVLELRFEEILPEKTNNVSDMPFELSDKRFIGLHDYLRMIEKAAGDDKIKGILLQPDLASLSMPEAAVLREALKTFRESGKFVYSYSKLLSQNAYYLASVADSVYFNPTGILEFRGLSAEVTYFKKMLDKLELEVDVFYAGEFKSATEPFRGTQMSDANRLQLREYLEDLFQIMLEDIGQSRGIDPGELRGIADRWSGFSPDSAQAQGLVDALLYEDQLDQRLRKRLGLEDKDRIPRINAQDYYNTAISRLDLGSKEKIALVFMEGEITMGKAQGGVITDDHYLKVLHKIEKDDKVKAVVLRINSPGGSVQASDNILRAIRNIQAKGKPVVVSMGQYAASGGYYIACYADSIFAQPTTLTGSIGVFSLLPNFGRFLDQKIGITFDTVRTTESSTYFTGVYGLSEGEKRLMQRLTDDIYADFLSKVSEGRGLDPEAVNAVAQGRIWTGRKALELGLVDRLGSTQEAIRCAAGMASLDTYRVDEYPKLKDPLQRLLAKITGEEDATGTLLRHELGDMYGYYQTLKSIRGMEGPQARLPFLIRE